ncbi:MAG: histidine phosphatase family protein [Firmicutes bacterium]|nr:histidine phosphatase family protein [Bacillota bacterium]
MKRIFLVRHGETDWNRQMRVQGREDVPLNDRGREQARRLSRRLGRKSISAIFSSPLSRARETAEIIAANHNLIPETVSGLAEIDFGDWEGKIYGEMDERERAAVTQWLSDPTLHSIPGGETLQQFQKRLEDCYKKLLDNHAAGNMAIVTHAGAIKVLVAGIMEASLAKIPRLRLMTASLSIILYDDWGNPYLELFNDTCHLSTE